MGHCRSGRFLFVRGNSRRGACGVFPRARIRVESVAVGRSCRSIYRGGCRDDQGRLFSPGMLLRDGHRHAMGCDVSSFQSGASSSASLRTSRPVVASLGPSDTALRTVRRGSFGSACLGSRQEEKVSGWCRGFAFGDRVHACAFGDVFLPGDAGFVRDADVFLSDTVPRSAFGARLSSSVPTESFQGRGVNSTGKKKRATGVPVARLVRDCLRYFFCSVVWL